MFRAVCLSCCRYISQGILCITSALKTTLYLLWHPSRRRNCSLSLEKEQYWRSWGRLLVKYVMVNSLVSQCKSRHPRTICGQWTICVPICREQRAMLRTHNYTARRHLDKFNITVSVKESQLHVAIVTTPPQVHLKYTFILKQIY